MQTTTRAGGRTLFSNNKHHGQSSKREELTEQQRLEIKQAFEVFDISGDHKLDFHELKTAMKALGFDASRPEVLQIIRDHDHAGTRRIGYDDFVTVMTAKILQRDPQDEIRRAFSLFDAGKTGKITFQDLKRVAQEIGESIDDEELQAMIDVFDLDNDGAISLEEFQSLCSD